MTSREHTFGEDLIGVARVEADPGRSGQRDLGELERHELEDLLELSGAPRFRARQVFQWIYRRGIVDFDAMTDLSRDLRAELMDRFTLAAPMVAAREQSTDGTEKFLFRLADGRQIESVFIPDSPAMTLCL